MVAFPNLIFLQLNELNFPFIADYAARGLLPGFARLFERHGYVETVSESEHRLANPWIQWPTVHTGLDYAEHGVFRLGDAANTDHRTIYEVLEEHGVRVAALCAFNAKNSTKNPAFFVPDPWTKTRVDAPASLRRINDAFCQVTDDYAKNHISAKSVANLVAGGLVNLQWKNIPNYLADTARFARGEKWMRAVVGDRLMADAFLKQHSKYKPNFATIFLNGGAHLQHHYMFSSTAYKGEHRNPEWLVPVGKDPLLEALKLYDQVLEDTLRYAKTLPNGRVIVATGLHQEPHERETFYYRLNDQVELLRLMNIQYETTYRLMTEDFVVTFESERDAAAAERMLLDVESDGIDPIFYVETGDADVRTLAVSTQVFHTENRGRDLYVQLRPMAKAMPAKVDLRRGNITIRNFEKMTCFAQYKNTHHHGTGYYSDTGFAAGELPERFPLRDLFPMFLATFGVSHPKVSAIEPALARALAARADLASSFAAE